jgi:hypothetical protein
MKAIRMRIQKNSRPLVILLATAVVILTTMVVANASQTFATPNAAKITYNLAPNANSAPITPAANTSVLVMGCCTTTGLLAVGHVSLLHTPGTLMAWTGVESHSGMPTTFASGTSDAPGAHIVFIDAAHVVDIQMASVDTIRVHNGSAGTRAGNVTLIW